MSQENIEIVRAAYEVAFAQRNVEGVLDRFAEDFTWQQRPDWPGRSVYGPAEMPLLWAELDDTYSELGMVPVEFVDAGEYVIVTVETSARIRGSHSRIEGRIWHLWRLRDGLASEGRAFGTWREGSEGLPGCQSDAGRRCQCGAYRGTRRSVVARSQIGAWPLLRATRCQALPGTPRHRAPRRPGAGHNHPGSLRPRDPRSLRPYAGDLARFRTGFA